MSSSSSSSLSSSAAFDSTIAFGMEWSGLCHSNDKEKWISAIDINFIGAQKLYSAYVRAHMSSTQVNRLSITSYRRDPENNIYDSSEAATIALTIEQIRSLTLCPRLFAKGGKITSDKCILLQLPEQFEQGQKYRLSITGADLIFRATVMKEADILSPPPIDGPILAVLKEMPICTLFSTMRFDIVRRIEAACVPWMEQSIALFQHSFPTQSIRERSADMMKSLIQCAVDRVENHIVLELVEKCKRKIRPLSNTDLLDHQKSEIFLKGISHEVYSWMMRRYFEYVIGNEITPEQNALINEICGNFKKDLISHK